MKKESSILMRIKKLEFEKSGSPKLSDNGKIIFESILDAQIYALKWVLCMNVDLKLYFCCRCEILHKQEICPNCGSDMTTLKESDNDIRN